jgi:hypothetical protein
MLSIVKPIALARSLSVLQAPGAGWVVAPAPPREVKRVYWDLFQTTDVWVRLTPSDSKGTAPLVSLIFQAFFPGRVQLEPYTLRPQWPKGTPARVVVRAEPFPLTTIRALSLQFVIDGYTFDLAGPGSRYALVPCGDDCIPNAIDAEIDPALLGALTTATVVTGDALGFSIRLAPDDQRALSAFAARAGIAPTVR